MRTASNEISECEQEPGPCSGGSGGDCGAGQAVGGRGGAVFKYELEGRSPRACSIPRRAYRFKRLIVCRNRAQQFEMSIIRTVRMASTKRCRRRFRQLSKRVVSAVIEAVLNFERDITCPARDIIFFVFFIVGH